MKIVQVYKDFEPPVYGGIEHTVRLQAHGMAARPGVSSVVLCSSHRPWTRVEQDGPVQVIRAATFGRLARAPVSPGLAGWLRRLRPDMLHFHFPNPTGELACLLAAPACPVVVTYHADIVRQKLLLKLYMMPLRRFLDRADRILVTTPATLQCNPLLEIHRDKCEVLPSGIETDRLLETSRTREVTRRLRDEHAGPVVLFVGRLRPYKGLPVLIEAMASLPGTLILVGRGEMESQVRAQVHRAGLEGRVHLVGDVADEDLAGYYRAADFFVLPSIHRNEAFGLVMLEAMHCGIPVISTRLGTGTSHVNLDGVTGLEVSPGDAQALAGAMRHLLLHPDVARRMGEEGRRRSAGFHADRMVERTAQVYEALLSSRTA